ncbi:DUF1731 domain-containing protein [Nonomuraea sp. NPDC050790]|uniref:DUF1731 domain-containing protein n=1 Tax=Nonomuraea sp. NPDC050790 TaxID=3364371 RepID=UPI0037AD3DC7
MKYALAGGTGARGQRPAPTAPASMVRLGARLLRTDPALALTRRRCVPTRLLGSAFHFRHPDLNEALTHLLTAP